MLKIYFLSTEIMPFSKTYSLSSFSKELSIMLNNDKNIDIRLSQPKYGYISDRRFILREVIRLKDMEFKFNNKEEKINIKSGFIPDSRVQVYFMEHKDYFFNVPELIYKSRNGRFYTNNLEKFSFFSMGAMHTLQKLCWIPDILVCNDWQLSLLPLIFKEQFKETFPKMKIVFIPHTYNDNYLIKKEVFNSLRLSYKSNKKTYNTFANAIDNSDLTFFLDNSTLKSAMKKKENRESLEKANYDTIEYNEEMSVSERMEAYNTIISKLTKL